MKKIFFLILVSAFVTVGVSTSVHGEVNFRQIAVTGQPAPGVNDGAEYDSFSSPQLNASNEVAFRAGLRTGTGSEVTFINDAAIYRSDTGTVPSTSLLVREGELVQGASDSVVFGTLPKSFPFNSSGDIAFPTGLRTSSGPVLDFDRDSGIYGPTSGAGSAYGLLVREGDLAPDVLDGAEFAGFSGLYLNDAGYIAIKSSLRTGTGEAIRTSGPDSNSEAVFGSSVGAGSTLGLILREDDPAPGASDAAEIDSPILRGFGNGVALIQTSLRTGAGTPVQNSRPDNNNLAILGPTSGGLGIVVRIDDVPPGLSDGAEVSDIQVPTINAAGDVASSLRLRVETSPGEFDFTIPAIYGPISGSGSTQGIVAREDGLAPGTDGALYDNLSSRSPELNSSGDLAFEGWIKTGTGEVVTEDNNNSIFGPISGVGSTLGLVAREGNTAPGGNDSAQFDNFSEPVLSDNGDLAFFADLQTGDPQNEVNSTNDFGLFAYVDGLLELIIRTGDLVDVQFGATVESRTVSGIGLAGTDVNDATVKFNENGLLAYGLEFTDGTSGIFTTSTRIATNFDGDYDFDGDVDGADFLSWQRNPGVGNLSDWQTNYGNITGNLANLAAIPEPSTLLLIVMVVATAMMINRPPLMTSTLCDARSTIGPL